MSVYIYILKYTIQVSACSGTNFTAFKLHAHKSLSKVYIYLLNVTYIKKSLVNSFVLLLLKYTIQVSACKSCFTAFSIQSNTRHTHHISIKLLARYHALWSEICRLTSMKVL